MTQYESVFMAASQLSVDEQLQLINDLSALVPDNHPAEFSSDSIAEFDRRDAELDSGEVIAIPWETVRKELFTQVGLLNRAD